jgi:hypothetical protein
VTAYNRPARKCRAFLSEDDFDIARMNGIESIYATFKNAGVKMPVCIALRIGVSLEARQNLISILNTNAEILYAKGYNNCAVDILYSDLDAMGFVLPHSNLPTPVPEICAK